MRRSLFWRGIRARRWGSIALLGAAVVVIASAVAGPVFGAAAEESISRDTIAAVPGGASLRLQAEISPFDPTLPPSLLADILPVAPAPGRYAGFPTRIATMTLPTRVLVTRMLGLQSTELIWRQGFCEHLRIVAGRCPSGSGEALVSRSTATSAPAWRLGARLSTAAAGRLRVVGIYVPDPGAGPLWNGADFLGGALPSPDPSAAGGAQETAVDAVFVPEQTFLDRVQSGARAVLTYPLDADAIPIGDGHGLRAEIADLRHRLSATHWVVHDDVTGAIRAANAQRQYVSQGAAFITVQLIVLGGIVLFFVVQDLLHARRREIALARLRGQGLLAALRFVLVEPAAVLVVALPIGILLGWSLDAVLGAAVLRPGTPVVLPSEAMISAGVTALGALAAVGVVAFGIVRRPVLEQWGPVAPHPRRALARGGLMLCLITAVAAVLLVAARGTAALVLVPVLALIAAAVVHAALLVLVATHVATRSRASQRVVRFLASRRLARSVAVRRTAMLLVITTGLAAFGAGGQSILIGDRIARAEGELGAERVVAVAPGPIDALAAVRRADPDGRWAMAAAQWLPNGGDSVLGTVLAVDATRLGAVGLPTRGGPTLQRLTALLHSTYPPVLKVPNGRITVRMTVRDLHGPAAPEALLDLADDTTNAASSVSLGPLVPGRHEYSADVHCATGCTIAGFTWSHPASATAATAIAGTVTVERIADRAGRLPALLGRDRAWRAAVPISESSDDVTSNGDGVTDAFRTTSGDSGIVYAATPAVPPAVVTPDGVERRRPAGGWTVSDTSGASLPFTVAGTVPLLPRVLDDGVLMDLRALDSRLPDFSGSARWEVWLSGAAPPDAVRRLQRAGLSVLGERSVEQRVAELSREGPALAFSLLSGLAAAAAILALVATGVAAIVTARERAREIAAMRLIGVAEGQILRAAVLEQVLLLAASVLVGVALSLPLDRLVLPLLRQSATATPVPSAYAPDPLVLVGFVLVAGIAIVAVGVSTGVTAARAAGLQRLREVSG